MREPSSNLQPELSRAANFDRGRAAVELFHLQGLEMNEVAGRMGKTPPSVAGLLRRGLKALREHMERR